MTGSTAFFGSAATTFQPSSIEPWAEVTGVATAG